MILLISINPKYAGMTSAMALSLRYGGYKGPIKIVTDCEIPHNDIIGAEIEKTTEKNPFKLKCQMYELSDFERTLYIDVDNVVNKSADIPRWLKSLEGKSLAFTSYEKVKYSDEKSPMIWTDHKNIFDHYELKKRSIMERMTTNAVYFERSDENAELFAEIVKMYDNPIEGAKDIGSFYPEEIPFMAALTKLKRKSDIADFDPCYFRFYLDVKWPTVQSLFYFLGYGGTYWDEFYANVVNKHIKVAYDHFELSHPHRISKADKILYKR